MPKHNDPLAARGDASPAMGLARLEDLDDFKVADGFPDPRGWDVKTPDGRTIGEVKHLLVDKNAMRVRYLDVELKDEFTKPRDTGRVQIPIGVARLDDDKDDVIVSLDAAGLAGLGAGTADVARTASADAGDARFDDRQFLGRRAAGREGEAYLVLHEEQLAVRKRAAPAGEVEVRKTVETQRVQETVPVMREEVTLERRPITGTDAARDATIGEETVRVPLMAEQVVAEKRVVPTEEVVIRKQAVTENQVVEGTVRRERLDVDRSGVTDRDAGR